MAHTLLASAPHRAIGRLHDALVDPARRERSALAALTVYALAWALYGAIAKSSQDVHADMAELVAWAREPAFGYVKHPPLAAWLVNGWFAIFPVADWSYYLLAAATAAVALAIVWRLSARYLDAEKRVAGVALLTLIPFFGFHALKFNVNTVLIPLWAATTLCFLRSFETRALHWAALAGLCAAAAMLGKYWSIFLLAGLALAALADPRRGAYFRSAAPWVSIVVGALALAPHLAWLVSHDFAPFGYAVAVHGTKSLADVALGAAGYLIGSAGYVALPVLLVLLAARPDRAARADLLWPHAPERRLAAVAFWAPLLLPVAGALASGGEINSLWSMSAWTLLPVVLLSSPTVAIARRAGVRILALAVALPPIMLAASPLIAIALHRGGMAPEQIHASVLAEPVARLWRETTARPLRFAGGDMAYQLAFYLTDRPVAFPDFNVREAPWIDEARVAREGLAATCRVDNLACVERAERLAAAGPAGRRTEVTLARRHFGTAGASARYLIVIIPPK